MALIINTNIASLDAQNNLTRNQATLNLSLQRLSSGLRINSAADDAAGYAISTGLTSQINGMNQAIRNAGDGLSLLGTAESAIGQQTNLLQRLRELAVQASSDTNSNANRASIESEAAQDISEFNRIALSTSFNGNNLLDGSFQAKDLQIGANATSNDRISLSLSSTRAADVGSAYKMTSASVTGTALAAGDVTLTVDGTTYTVGASVSDGVSTVDDTASALAKANAINAISNSTGVTATAASTVTAGSAQTAGTVGANDLTINGVSIGGYVLSSATDQAGVAAINAKSAETGVTAALNSSNEIVLTSSDGRNITVASANTTFSGFANGTTTTYGTMTLRSTGAFTVGGGTVANAGLTAGAASLATSENVGSIDLTSKDNAQLAINIIDVAMSELNSAQSNIGALTNRINSASSNLSSAVENATAANSRIQDADFASETASLTRSQILQQASVAILAQANQNPQLALSLLK